jgi:hypothetical protein
MKEFVARSGIEVQAINVLEQPERAAKLSALGLYPPALCVDDECVSGTGLDAVARLLGVRFERPPLLEPAELTARYELLLDAACRFIAQLPAGGLSFALPGRDRPVLDIANQTVSVIRGFLAAYDGGVHDRQFAQRPEHVRSVDDLLARAAETKERFRAWREREGANDPLDRVIDTPWWGRRTLHEVFEREVWHTAQHTRQLMMALELLGVTPDQPLTDTDLAGLNVPAGVHG